MKIFLIILCVIAYCAAIPFAYRLLKSDANSKFENIWFACIWPLMVLGWIFTGCKKIR